MFLKSFFAFLGGIRRFSTCTSTATLFYVREMHYVISPNRQVRNVEFMDTPLGRTYLEDAKMTAYLELVLAQFHSN